MRLYGDTEKAALAPAIALALGFAVAACAPADRLESTELSAVLPTLSQDLGPSGDFPVIIGEPFTIDGITYTPSNVLNYDDVGYAGVDSEAASGVTIAHRTLPLPSYVEITSLESGTTILARVERRGPMVNSSLISMSQAAMEQLGVSEGAPVRVRRVNPPEEQRFELRADREAPLRMETPAGLLDVLRRKLPAVGSASLRRDAENLAVERDVTPESVSIDPDAELDAVADAGVEFPSLNEGPTPAQTEPGTVESGLFETETVDPDPDEAVQPMPVAGDYVVQAGAFSAKVTADRIAREINGFVEPTGRLWRVRVGPFSSRGQANAALAKVRGAGYRGAQVYRVR